MTTVINKKKEKELKSFRRKILRTIFGPNITNENDIKVQR